jgi:peptidoglycan hydrolase-like protein with peptidoglycan-binding domain
MAYTPPDYHTAHTVGTGQSNPADVRKVRSALRRTGYGRFPPRGATNVTPGLARAIRNFQTEYGLKPDGVIRPGGPTERALSMTLHARNRDGEAAMAAPPVSRADAMDCGSATHAVASSP